MFSPAGTQYRHSVRSLFTFIKISVGKIYSQDKVLCIFSQLLKYLLNKILLLNFKKRI